MKKKLLVAVANGYLGSNLISYFLKSSKYLVYGMQRVGDEIEVIYHDMNGSKHIILRTNLLSEIFKSIKFDIIINVAADIRKTSGPDSVRPLIESNVLFAIELASWASETNVNRYIFLSSFSTHLNKDNYFPQTLYAATKKATEDILVFYAQSRQLPVTVLASYDIYGPHQPHKRLIPELVKAIRNGTQFTINGGDQKFCPIYINDVVGAIEIALDSKDLGINFYCLFGPEVFQVKEIPSIISNILCLPIYASQISCNFNYRDNEIMEIDPRFPLLPNWKPQTTFAQGILRLVQESKGNN